jgi:anti-anti-sigma factor
LDLENLEPLVRRLEAAAAAGPAVILDAGGITFGDSSFLRVLLTLHQSTDLRIAAPRPVLERLITVVGMDRVLKLYPSVEAAMAAPLEP